MRPFFPFPISDETETRNIQLTGAALEALREFDSTVDSLKELLKQAKQKFARTLNRELGLELNEDEPKVDREYLKEFGFAVLKVPVEPVLGESKDAPNFETIGSNPADPETVDA